MPLYFWGHNSGINIIWGIAKTRSAESADSPNWAICQEFTNEVAGAVTDPCFGVGVVF